MSDPYQILGISPSASDEEVKKAYRSLSRRYHPDANVNNPNAAQAEEKFKEVQQAYEQIMKERELRARGGSSQGGQAYGPGSSRGYDGSAYDGDRNADGDGYGYGYGPFGGFGFGGFGPFGFGGFGDPFGSYGRQRQTETYSGYTEEESGRLKAAVNYINAGHYQEARTVLDSLQNRGALWYYLAAHAESGLGNNVTALEYAKRAAALEPQNEEYASYLNSLSGGGEWYERRGTDFGRGGGPMARTCAQIACSLALCSCCGSGGSLLPCLCWC